MQFQNKPKNKVLLANRKLTRQSQLVELQSRFKIQAKVAKTMPQYDALTDRYCASYFSKKPIRTHLKKMIKALKVLPQTLKNKQVIETINLKVQPESDDFFVLRQTYDIKNAQRMKSPQKSLARHKLSTQQSIFECYSQHNKLAFHNKSNKIRFTRAQRSIIAQKYKRIREYSKQKQRLQSQKQITQQNYVNNVLVESTNKLAAKERSANHTKLTHESFVAFLRSKKEQIKQSQQNRTIQ